MLRLGQHILVLLFKTAFYSEVQTLFGVTVYVTTDKQESMTVKSNCHRGSSEPHSNIILCFVTNIPTCLSLCFFVVVPIMMKSLRCLEIQSTFSAQPKKVLGTERHAAALGFWLKSFQNGNFPLSLRAGYL